MNFRKRFLVAPGKRVKLGHVDADFHGDIKSERADEILDHHKARITAAQRLLYADRSHALLIVLQGIDGAGKDGTCWHVISAMDPQGVKVTGFKQPTPAESEHDFLWRVHPHVPGRGEVAVFNRSHYEDVLVVRVHRLVPKPVWKARYDLINDFEHLLHAENRTTILKFFLYISKDEQKKRLQARIDHPDKNWKYNPEDLTQREHWDSYMQAYEDAINLCSTDYSPWYVVPANKKWSRNLIIMRTIVNTLTAMDPQYPPPVPDLDKVAIE
jgi:PPK2 family polyphosphate:nucleotide phosphotransferase